MQLIKDWKDWWRWWSLRLTAAGTALSGYLMANPDIAVTMWLQIPDDIRQYLPPEYMPAIGLFVVLVGQVARFLKQNQPKSVAARLANTLPLMVSDDEPENPVEGLHLWVPSRQKLIVYRNGKWYVHK